MPALVTPFTEDGDLSEAAHLHNLRVLTEAGIAGFLLAGSTGEGPYLEPGERQRLVASSRDELGPQAFLLCGIAAETRRAALEQLAEAETAGADAGVVMTPTTLIRGDHGAVSDHYRALAEDAPLPIMIYSVPPYTAYEPPVEVVSALAEHPNIVGMKDSGGDADRIGQIAVSVPRDFFLFTGSTAVLRDALLAGAYGAITASCNYLPGYVQRVAAAPDSPEAADTQEALAQVAKVVEAHRVPGVKAAAEFVGLRPGQPRPPLRPVAPDDHAEIAEALSSLPEAGATISAN